MELDRKPDFKKLEEKWQKSWEKSKIYKFDPKSKKPVYSIDTPPPYASGDHLHVGHALNYTQFELISRYKRMNGFNVYFPPCFDNNGLPTEKYVEEKYKLTKTSMSRAKFRALCRKEAAKVEKDYTQKFFKALGHAYDWDLIYTTIGPEAQKVAQTSFVDLYKKGHAYRAEEPTLWCPHHQTALAQAEVEDAQRKTKLNWIYFELETGKKIEIATTRPEFLPACVGVFVNPKDKRYNQLIGKRAKVPLFNYGVPIMADEKVDMEFGSGLVMICTFGDSTDIEWWKKHKLPLKIAITKEGKMTNIANKYAGLPIKQAQAAILEDLESWGLLVKQEPLEQTVGVCWRCSTPIEFLVTKQWFIKTLAFKKELIKQGRKINWHPDFYRKRFEDWTNNLGWDWIISRQRYYGVPMPIWYCKKCGKEQIANPSILPIDPFESKPAVKCECGASDFEPEEDVFDTWMTSSMSPEIAVRWLENPTSFKKIFPTSLRPQSHDIIRTWAFYTILKSYLHFDSIPWTDVMISNYVLDPKGKGMSKSKGNAVWLKDLLENYSADAVRYWVSSVSLGKDMPFKEQDIVRGSKILNKLWNSSRFIAMNLDKVPKTKPKLELADQWILSRLAETVNNYTKHFDSYAISKARTEVEQFFLHEFCDFYLEMTKYRTYGENKKSKDAARWTLNTCLLEILKMFAPLTPHITEEIYEKLYKKQSKVKSIHLTEFPKNLKADKAAIKLGEQACSIISEIRQHKQKQGMSMGKELESYKLKKKPKDWKKIELLVKKTMRVNQII
jgi:valyl-tRNA synthetase